MAHDVCNPRHAVGRDPLIVSLREKYYAESGPVDVAMLRLFVVQEQEGKRKFRCLMHPGGYISSPFSNTQEWKKDEWKRLLKSVRSKKGWDVCRLTILDDSAAENLVEQARVLGMRTWATRSCFKGISGPKTWEVYKESRKSNFNHNQARCLRRMEREKFEFTDSLDFDQIMRVYAARGAITGSDDYSLTPKFSGFLRELREQMIAAGRWLECGVQKDGKLSGFTFGFWDSDHTFYMFQTCYDPAHGPLRLGALTYDRLIEKVLNEGCEWVSFMGESAYMDNFTQESFDFHVLDIFSTGLRGRMLYARRVFYRTGAQVLARLRSARATVRSMRSRLKHE